VTISRIERLAGALVGLLIGDALGVPYEFHDPSTLSPLAEIDFQPPDHFLRSHPGVPPGTWSDDGAQALVLLHSLLECGGFDARHFARGLLHWYDDGFMAVDGVFDVGVQTATALGQLKMGIPPLEAGAGDKRSNGNGSLMRVLPLALWHRGTDEELVRDARQQSRVTHAHLRSQLCCALYCLWARGVLEDIPQPFDWAVATLRGLYDETTPERAELDFFIRPDDAHQCRGSGYVVDSLFSARWACEKGDFEAVVKFAISLGQDTDTTACLAGGIAGLQLGLKAIPVHWREALRGDRLYEPLLDRLLQWADSAESTPKSWRA
jgi:ADP-ribosyl-[dinitrogen reductase] hydrolase